MYVQGEQGVKDLLEILRRELKLAMQLSGETSLSCVFEQQVEKVGVVHFWFLEKHHFQFVLPDLMVDEVNGLFLCR